MDICLQTQLNFVALSDNWRHSRIFSLLQANGRLMCLGSAQHLKSKFGKGYQLELKVQCVDREDADFQHYVTELTRCQQGNVADEEAQPSHHDLTADIVFSLEEAKAALHALTGDQLLSNMLHPKDPVGFTVWKDAVAPTGVDVVALAAFLCTEVRMRKLELFIAMSFPKHVLRERQDTKARYEVDSVAGEIKISSIFASIEQYKEKLRLADYSVSQTSLEQVFNMHAAEAERMKLRQIDG
jgi:ATP-binding cassette, subfamily A (ABC1), member 3